MVPHVVPPGVAPVGLRLKRNSTGGSRAFVSHTGCRGWLLLAVGRPAHLDVRPVGGRSMVCIKLDHRSSMPGQRPPPDVRLASLEPRARTRMPPHSTLKNAKENHSGGRVADARLSREGLQRSLERLIRSYFLHAPVIPFQRSQVVRALRRNKLHLVNSLRGRRNSNFVKEARAFCGFQSDVLPMSVELLLADTSAYVCMY